jgi:hypothetical protein
VEKLNFHSSNKETMATTTNPYEASICRQEEGKINHIRNKAKKLSWSLSKQQAKIKVSLRSNPDPSRFIVETARKHRNKIG